MKKPIAVPMLAAICLALAPGCSQAGEPAERTAATAPASPVPAATAAAPVAAETTAVGAEQAAPAAGGSRVLGEKDITLRGKPACEVRFIYAGREAEDLFWEEPCASVSASMMTQRELERFDKWDRLDDFARKFVNALPGGEVLYVEGEFSASIYPVGTTGSTYEVSVAD